MTDVPGNPGAPAACLYFERKDDKRNRTISVFKRVKILTPAGRDYANLEHYYYPIIEEVKNIRIRVTKPDGTSRDVRPDILEKTVAKMGKLEYRAKTMAVPDISAGCIIDYCYDIFPRAVGLPELSILFASSRAFLIPGLLEGDNGSILAVHWDIQDRIFIRKARFIFVPGAVFTLSGGGEKFHLLWASNKLKNAQPRITDAGLDLEVSDIPSLGEEELMPPASNERACFDVYYLDSKIADIKEYWDRAAEAWRKDSERFIGGKNDLKAEVFKIMGRESDRALGLQKLYERVQGIRNLSREHEITGREERKLKDNKKATDVLKHNYGYEMDITRTFVALARAAGYEARLVRVVSRDDKLFRQALPSFYGQFDSEIALVKVGDRIQAFDPGTPHCPFGLVHWPKSGTAGLAVENGQMAVFNTPTFSPELALSQREIVLTMDNEGGLVGKVRVSYQGQEALVRRLKFIHEDEVKVKEELEEEMKRILPSGARVSMMSVSGLTDNSHLVVVEYEVGVPLIINEAGDRLTLPIYPLTNPDRYPFRSSRRTHPVFFNYPYREFDDISISLPGNLIVEALPASKKRDTDFSAFSLVKVMEGQQRIRIQRDLSVKRNVFPVAQYQQLKEFFDYIRSGDEEQIILRKMTSGFRSSGLLAH